MSYSQEAPKRNRHNGSVAPATTYLLSSHFQPFLVFQSGFCQLVWAITMLGLFVPDIICSCSFLQFHLITEGHLISRCCIPVNTNKVVSVLLLGLYEQLMSPHCKTQGNRHMHRHLRLSHSNQPFSTARFGFRPTTR